MKGLPKFDSIGSFAVSEDDAFLPDVEPAQLKSVRLPIRLEDIQEIKRDYFSVHYKNCYHDCTLKALGRQLGELQNIGQLYQIVSDRRTLRKIVTNCCIDLRHINNPYHCKRQDFDVMVENLNGTLLIACMVRHEEEKGGYGQSFEEKLTHSPVHGNRMATYQVCKLDLGSQTCAIRFEVDAVNQHGELVELKSRKKPNPRYGLGPDFFLNIWIQMVLSNTPHMKLGVHDQGLLHEVVDCSAEEVQRKAGLPDGAVAAAQLFRRLSDVLANMRAQVAEGRQAVFKFTSQSFLSYTAVEITEAKTFSLPLVSPEMRAAVLLQPSEEGKKGTAAATEAPSLLPLPSSSSSQRAAVGEGDAVGGKQQESLELAMERLKLGKSSDHSGEKGGRK